MTFGFATASRIAFGRGIVDSIPREVQNLGSRVFLVTGGNPERSTPLVHSLREQGDVVERYRIDGEPTTLTVQEGTERGREMGCEVVIALGGGSAIDAGKAIAALITNSGDVTAYLEVVGEGRPITRPPLPFIAVPTTAGTGSEVTRNAVIGSSEHRVKVSMRSQLMLPTLAVVDPILTVTMSKETTAATGLDALTQLIEPYVCRSPNPITDSLCREGMARAARSIVRAYQDGEDVDAREDMCVASLFGGLALANAKLGAVHGFAGPIGGMFDAPHGAVCARLLPLVIDANINALKARGTSRTAFTRFEEVARILTRDTNASADDAVEWTKAIGKTLVLPPLSDFGLQASDIPDIVEKSLKASSMKGNPITLTTAELFAILERAL